MRAGSWRTRPSDEVRQRRYVERVDRVVVPERVRRDGHPRGDTPGDTGPRRAGSAWPAERDQQDPRDHGQDARDGHGIGSVAQHEHGEHEGQQRAGPARQRVDQVEVAALVTPLEHQLVDGVEERRQRPGVHPRPLRPVAPDHRPHDGHRPPEHAPTRPRRARRRRPRRPRTRFAARFQSACSTAAVSTSASACTLIDHRRYRASRRRRSEVLARPGHEIAQHRDERHPRLGQAVADRHGRTLVDLAQHQAGAGRARPAGRRAPSR